MNSKQNLTSVDLRPDRKLIDVNFDSYKLSLTPLPSFRAAFNCGLQKVEVSEEHATYEKIRCLTLHNYLSIDPWNLDCAYLVDAHGCIRRFYVSVESHIEPAQIVFTFGVDNTARPKLPPCILFPSPHIAIASDGIGSFFVLRTAVRSERSAEKWSIIFNEESTDPCLLLHSVFRDNGTHYLDLLLLRFGKPSNDDDKKVNIVIDWVCLEKPENTEKFDVSGIKTFEGKSVPNYAAISADCSELYIASTFPFKHIPGWGNEEEVQLADDSETNESKDGTEPPYKWKQTAEDVTISIPLPEGINKSCVVYSLNSSKLSIALRDPKTNEANTILAGEMYMEAEAEASSWMIDGDTLIVTIQKKIEGHTWAMVIEGDNRGEMEVNPEEVARVHQQLAHLTSETLNTEKSEGQLFNSGEIEECDSYYDSEASLVRFDASTNKFTHSANISSLKWLFNLSSSPNESPCVVLRHDVDAVVWQPTAPNPLKGSNRIIWKHQATFNALGYVHASKTNLKFCGAAPDASYAALCECQRRIFVYRQPTALASPLRNRSSGEVVRKVSLQQVATLPNNEDVYGFAVSNDRMYVLTESELVVFKVGVDAGA
uniref:NudC domain-containing protein 1 n=1 Tax=Phallusia mammillata TaxID=59560 RepID=A0A6F9DN67_9ASCI|nr:nudC domain-containing protein 1-like [Phallusia mammillata]